MPPGLEHRNALQHVYKIIHSQHAEHLAWGGPRYGWTQFRRGITYTWREALECELGGGIMEEGRWYAFGTLIYLVE